MASKYDRFWEQQAPVLRGVIDDAAAGRTVAVDLPAIATLGQRISWVVTATVHASSVVAASMAHMVALARFVASSHVCSSPDEMFVFSINSRCSLTVRTRQAADNPPGRPSGQLDSAPRIHTRCSVGGGRAVDATRACEAIHAAVSHVPRYNAPGDVPFSNGLYFFFEAGEESPHGRPRITRIGNHPRTQGRLVGRLRDHYATRPNAKNGSVFRRYLGGALLRNDGMEGCLAPGPGLGHWEMGTGLECECCVGCEDRVTARLRYSFTFACVQIDDQKLRNHLERCPATD